MKQSITNLQEYFLEKHTLSYHFRLKQLKKFKKALIEHEEELILAIGKDLNKNPYEVQISELLLLYQEINTHIKQLKNWMAPQKVKSSLFNYPSKDYINSHPYGTILIISPWNYPILLSLLPLIGAISAGNSIVLKPSEFTPYTSQAILHLIESTFDPHYIHVILGDHKVANELTQFKWGKIFFTGSTQIGQKVYEAAAKNLTPVTLELGGKSPCILMKDTPLEASIQRIFLGKFMNAGQTCIAPDYVWIHESQAEQFIQLFNEYAILHSEGMTAIINEHHLDRLKKILPKNQTYKNRPQAFLVDDFESTLMQEEIFGPLLPVIIYKNKSEIILQQQKMNPPLAFYVFCKDPIYAKKWLENFHFGGAVINDVLLHLVNNQLPFGGVGTSGIGNYHGQFSFNCFSYQRPIVVKKGWKDLSLKKPPFIHKNRKWINLYSRFLKK